MNILLIICSCLFFVGYGIGITYFQTSSTTKRVVASIIVGILAPIVILKLIGELLVKRTIILGLLIKKFKQ